MAERLSNCSVDTVPIQILNTWGDNPKTTLSAAGSPSGIPSFNTFVTTVTEHLAAKLDQKNLCLENPESQERSLVQFAHLYLSPSEDDHRLAAVRPLEARSSDVCRIISPWIDIAIEREPVPSVRAIIRFSERQLLADQAVLGGGQNLPLGVAIPPSLEESKRYIFAYTDSELYFFYNPKEPGEEPIERPTRKQLEEMVPPDFLWLLDRTPHNGFFPLHLSVDSTMGSAMEAGAEAYTNIVITLIDQCFESVGSVRRYDSINDVADLVPLQQYKIIMPYIRQRR